MPELPEVETTRRGIAPHVLGKKILHIEIRRRDLRQPIPDSIESCAGLRFLAVERRSKYLIFHLENDQALLLHLGMSGSLRVCQTDQTWKRHDHFALQIDLSQQLRYHDPRRFGLLLHLSRRQIATHPLLSHLGPEPLSADFTSSGLQARLQKSQRAIKLSLMDARIVVGVGNIYAAEALFLARIHPQQPSSTLSLAQCRKLCRSIRVVLGRSIRQGGTTLRDFVNENGQPGYFRQQLNVYDRADACCRRCESIIVRIIQGQRSTFFCPHCQPEAPRSRTRAKITPANPKKIPEKRKS